jgi:predicted RNA-binding Zn ribbon-like protein
MSLLTSDAMEHVHACKSETCRWVFLDTSKNHSRRWCDMKICGNRMKARRVRKDIFLGGATRRVRIYSGSADP